MHPTTIIELTLLLGATIGIGLIALLLPLKFRKIIWIVSCMAFIIVLIFYGVRPFIVEFQTNQAKVELENHFLEKYNGDSWSITDTDQHELESEVYLHVIFESEPKVVYEYIVENTKIEQVGMWMLSGQTLQESGIKPQHEEHY